MKNKGIPIIGTFFIICGLFLACQNGLTINKKSFRSVTNFLLPEVDEPTGLAVFTSEFTLTKEDGQKEIGRYEHIDNESGFLQVTELSGTETILNARLALNGLIDDKYGNVKVTTVWTPADAENTSLVKEVHFDKYTFMVFTANTGVTGYDPSNVDVQIKLDTNTKDQIGILSFKFEYAQSVYDSTKCLQEYQLIISTGTENKPFVILSRMRATDAPENSFSFAGLKSSYTASYTDFVAHKVPQEVTKNMAIDLLYIDSAYPLTLRLEDTNNTFSILDVMPMSISGSKGIFTFKLNFKPGNLIPDGSSNTGNLIIEDPAGYYANLPLRIPLTAKRKIPEIPNIGGTFQTDGDASPWRWRMQYRVNLEAKSGSTVVTGIKEELLKGVQNGGKNLESIHIYEK